MSPTLREPIAVVRAFMTAMQKQDYDAGAPSVADNCEYSNGPLGTVHGMAGIRAVLEPFFAPIDENKFIILREAASGPIVFIERLDRHRIGDLWIELPVTGVLEVHDARITVWHEYFDVATIMNQMPGAAA